ncbi:copper homeostasis protein CutC [Clostridium sp. DSM 100503]|uniref:copper homeostasis protein CutC n=1 Tax=Clostridium sp. DSM 100503 TaxID=2963282 RepID=UPI00214A210C|nr:copper homeostasis protein CutC [Clostridium sp. DSM 100503]MCR1950464.1 copper homeostasis protein CutC [Clostridium sp. DSM 100503]
MNIYEACVGNYNDAVRAEALGANRIELCDNLLEDGTTPSFGTIKKAVENLNIPVMVIIRPRGGNFEYSEDEADIMIQDIKVCKDLGAYGVVIGALKGNTIDLDLTKKMVEEAKPMKVTFHMAFDSIDDKKSAIDDLVKLGVDRILTKGGCENALASKDKLKELVDYAKDRIIIMPGKGVNKDNRDYILEYTGAKEIHGTKVV